MARPQHGFGLTLTKAQWVHRATAAVLNLLEEQLAAPRAEIDARLHEHGLPHGGRRIKFDPHIITDAVNQLRTLGAIQERQHITKGGSTVPLFVVGDDHNRSTAVQRAVGRKAMLYRRFRLLSDQAGRAGEQVLRHSLLTAGPHLTPMEPGYGEVRRAMNVPLYGPLDSGAWLNAIDPASGLPRRPVALPIEMKNRRLTLYPIHKEVHQLLSKAAAMQQRHPDYPIVPVLVCRRAHPRLFWMAKDLGFLVHTAERQFTSLPRGITHRLFEEVRTGLGLTDLTAVSSTQQPRIIQFFEETVPNRAHLQATRWAVTASTVLAYSERLRDPAPSPTERADAIRALRQAVQVTLPAAGFTGDFGWSLPDRDSEHDVYEEFEEYDDDDVRAEVRRTALPQGGEHRLRPARTENRGRSRRRRPRAGRLVRGSRQERPLHPAIQVMIAPVLSARLVAVDQPNHRDTRES